jgi:hypothetical protein
MSLTTAAHPSAVPTSSPIPPSDSPAEPPLWPISVAMYTAMIEAGILREADCVYLWKGRLAQRMTINRPHSLSLLKAADALRAILPDGYHVETEQPMSLRLEPSVPQPDLMIPRGRYEDYPRDFPSTADVALIVEVADTSLSSDRAMAPTYAAEGVPVYWITNIPGRRLEVHSEPDQGAYTRVTPFEPEDDVPVVLDGREVGRVRVADLLP